MQHHCSMAAEHSTPSTQHSCSWCQKFLLDFDESGDPPQSISLDLCDPSEFQAIIKMVNLPKGLSYYRDTEQAEIGPQTSLLRITPGFEDAILAASVNNCLFAKAIVEKLRTPNGDFHIQEIFVWRRGIEFVGLQSKLHIQADHIMYNASSDLYRMNPFESRVPLPTLRSVADWLAVCNKSHPECRQRNTSFMPKRLLEISDDGGSKHVRLVSLQNRRPYTALSYCWGPNSGISSTIDLMETWKAQIPWARIPETVQDAILVTVQLDIQYLWVDRFCIIQDNEVEIQLEIAKMPEIYNCAEVTISATRARAANDGFLNSDKYGEFRYTEEKFTLPGRLNGSNVSAYVGTPPSRHLMSGESWLMPQPLDTRAWPLQESLVSRRILYFNLRDARWECRRTQAMDPEKVAGLHVLSFYLPPTLSRMRNRANFDSIIASGILHNEQGVRMSQRLRLQHSDAPDIHPWHALVEEYTDLSMTNSKDRARAISGIAARISLRTGDEYYAGLWRSTLSNQLGWFCLTQPWSGPFDLLYTFAEWGNYRTDLGFICDVNQEQQRRTNGLKAPSWSWTSVDGPVRFLVNTLSPTIEVIDVKVELENSQAPFGDVNWGHLTVRGSVRYGRSIMKPSKADEEARSTRAMSYDDRTNKSPALMLKLGTYICAEATKDSMAVCIELKKQKGGLWARHGIAIIPDSGWLGLDTIIIQ